MPHVHVVAIASGVHVVAIASLFHEHAWAARIHVGGTVMTALPTHSRETLYLLNASKDTFTSDFTNKLGSGVTLSSGAAVSQRRGPGSLTLGSPTINSGSAVTVSAGSESRTIAIGKCVQYTVDARGCPAGTYELLVVATDSSGNVSARIEELSVTA